MQVISTKTYNYKQSMQVGYRQTRMKWLQMRVLPKVCWTARRLTTGFTNKPVLPAVT